jgi:ELWxxDGT repeat protein
MIEAFKALASVAAQHAPSEGENADRTNRYLKTTTHLRGKGLTYTHTRLYSAQSGKRGISLMALSFFIRFASAIHQLWVSDGTSLGTKLVASLAGGAISNLRTTGSRVFFDATDGTRGQELWTSDGTAAGTVLLSDINPGSFRSSPSQLTQRQRHALLPGQ